MSAQDNTALHFIAETGFTSRSHNALCGNRAFAGLDADAVTHTVKTRQVRGNLSRHNQVVGSKSVIKARAGNLNDLSPGSTQLLNGRVEGLENIILVALTGKFADNANAQPLNLPVLGDLSNTFRERGNRLIQGRRVVGIVATDHLGQCSRVLNRARYRANLVQRRGHSDQSVTRNCAVCGLCAHGTRHSAGLTDRTTGI